MIEINKGESAGCRIVQQQADDEYEYAKKTIVADGAGGHGYEEDGKYRMLWVVVLSGVCPNKGIFLHPCNSACSEGNVMKAKINFCR